MHRYLLGLFFVQIATVVFLVLSLDAIDQLGWLYVLLPSVLLAIATACWFSALAKQEAQGEIAAIKEQHARERESLQVDAERAKTELVRETQQEIARQVHRAHTRANFKVGATFAGTAGIGALLLFTQFMTLGLLTIATAGGALGGYLWRATREVRRERRERLLPMQIPAAEIVRKVSDARAHAP